MTYGWQEDGSFKCLPEPPQGTLKGWQDAANMLCAAGCEAQTMALLASFAAPLMALFPTEEAAVVSIYGRRASGKSTAFTAVWTIWGDLPVGMEFGRGIPRLDSNLANRDPNFVKGLMKLAAISGPMGMWISTSGTPLLGSLFDPDFAEVGETVVPPGIEFEVAVPKALKEPGDKNRIESQLRMNRGHAGPLFIERLGGRLQWAEDKLAEKVALMRDETGRGHEWRIPMRAIAACWVAAILASDRILEIDPDRIARWAMAEVFTP